MYYKSLFEYLKDEDDENRLSIIEETSNVNGYYIRAKLIPKIDCKCPVCSSTNIMKFGKKERVINDDYISNRKTFIILEYNRLRCKDCLKMFNDTLPMLEARKSISLALKLNIIEDLRSDVSFTNIANKRHVSIQTIIDIFETYISYDRAPFGDVLCMDEFKNLKHSSGKYAFVMFDPNAHIIIDVLPDRIQANIDDYLYKIDWHEKDRVKYVITDMSESYRTLIKTHFKNAVHIVDCFHYLQYVEKAFNDVRIRIQSLFGENTPQYRILKRYWRILSTYYIDVEGESLYNPIRKKSTDVNQILLDATAVHPDLEEAYSITQNFLSSVKTLKYEEAEVWYNEWINTLNDSSCDEYRKLKGMFLNWKNEILHSFIRFGDKRLHNGYIEGINNKIKVIKRVSYGYTNFTHFRNRIIHIVNDYEFVLKHIDRSLIQRKKRKRK